MNPLVFGVALWVLFGFMLAFAIAPLFDQPTTPTPNEDDMSHLDDPCEFPLRFAFREDLPTIPEEVIDAFCHGYAQALLWADAYTYVQSDDEEAINGMAMEQDENAAYAYDSPGKWWEGMGIDFADALYFLSENMNTFSLLPRNGFEKDWHFWAQQGHDFLLTRNGHGAGFWDRGYPDEIGEILTEATRPYGEHQVLTDDSPRVTTL